MNNYKITIQYDGTDYCGWQIQKNELSVQQEIQKAIKIITKQDVNLIGSGRTDAGAHALGQVANFLIDQDLNEHKFLYSLNSILPDSISVKNIEKVPLEFHARFDAKKRKYIYLISRNKNPFISKFCYRYHYNINIDLLNEYASILKGEHNFYNLCKETPDVNHYNCFMYDIKFMLLNDIVICKIVANRFIFGMIRTIIGTLLKAQEKNLPVEFINDIINLKRENPFKQYLVPAKGLILHRVYY